MSTSTALLEQISRNMEIAGVPGLAFCRIVDRQMEPAQVLGVKDADSREPVAADTVFQAASLSKPVFAYGVLTLVQTGQLELDRPLHAYLPLPEANETPQLQQVTARQALTHTSGLQNWRFNAEDKLQFAFEPGTGFAYSGEGFFYLQRVVEKLSGQSLESFLQERVLRPFGMQHSTYLWRAELEALASMGHRDHGQRAEPWNMRMGRRLLEIAAQGGQPLETWRYEDHLRALPEVHASLAPLPNNLLPNVAGSLLTTAPDYARFIQCLLDPDNEISQRLLSSQHRLNSALSWGLGIGLEQVGPQVCFWHWGDNGFFGNFMFGNPRTGSGLVILTNEVRGLFICERILRALNGHDLAAFLWI